MRPYVPLAPGAAGGAVGGAAAGAAGGAAPGSEISLLRAAW